MIIEYPSNIEKYFESFEIINSVCWLPNAYIFSDLKTIACAATGSKFQTVNSQAKNFLPIWNGHIVEREHSRQTDVEFRKCSAFGEFFSRFEQCSWIWGRKRQIQKKFREWMTCISKQGVVDETAPCFLADYTKKARYKPDFKNIKEIGHTGFEPVNYGFRVHCLTNLANAQ